jgi:aldose 1-epimerase
VRLSERAFGDVTLYRLADDASGVRVGLIPYGASVVSLELPDRTGELVDVTPGFSSIDGYRGPHPHFGGIVGRFANRIAGAHFRLDDVDYRLAANDGPNHLHGGRLGFDRALWLAEPLEEADAVGVRFSHTSPDGDEGYPGQVNVTAEIRLMSGAELRFDYRAETTRATPLNLTWHGYLNLAGHGAGTILEHELQIDADQYLPVDDALIPTGGLRAVDGTRFDFRSPRPIASDFDHCFVLSGGARLHHPPSGRTVSVRTTQPGLQLYTGQQLDGSIIGKSATRYPARSAVCLEAQHFPNAPLDALLRPGEVYQHTTVYSFSAD